MVEQRCVIFVGFRGKSECLSHFQDVERNRSVRPCEEMSGSSPRPSGHAPPFSESLFRVSTSLYWVFLGFTGFLPRFIGFWLVSPSFLPIFTGLYLVLPSFTGFYWVLPSSTGFYWVLPSFTELYKDLTSFTYLYLV